MAGVRRQRAGPATPLDASVGHHGRPADEGVEARAAFDPRRHRPPLPAARRRADHPAVVLTGASDAPAGLAPPAVALGDLALDASRRASELLGGDGSSGLELLPHEDLARRAAALLGGRAGDLERLARRAGLAPRALGRMAIAWREGGRTAVGLVAGPDASPSPPSVPSAEVLHAGKAALVEAGVPATKVRVEGTALALVGQRARLYPAADGLWYRVERRPSGPEVTRPPSDDPADLVE